MSYQQFVDNHQGIWARTETLLGRLEDNNEWDVDLAELPELYRSCCHHLALARQRQYDPRLENRLHDIALRGYKALYRRRRTHIWRDLIRILTHDFPRMVRAHAGYFWLASVLFYGPMVAVGLLVLTDPDAIFSLMGQEQIAELEAMYRVRPAEERGSSADFTMFGFYIYHNISIAFRTFAAGLFAGLGSIFFLVLNGVFLGGVLAHMVHAESAIHLTSFVITHGAFELTGLVISGVAGLRLGAAVVAPGRLPRTEALRKAGKDCATLIFGITAMLLIAAFIEAFWSSIAGIPPAAKYGSGAVAWLVVCLYLGMAGRSGNSEHDLGS